MRPAVLLMNHVIRSLIWARMWGRFHWRFVARLLHGMSVVCSLFQILSELETFLSLRGR